MKKSLAALLLASSPTWALALQEPRSGPVDPRVKSVVYNPRDVVSIRGYYGFQQMIEFDPNEKIEVISVGDSIAWSVVANSAGNRLFLKPLEPNARTNLAIVTNVRSYNFELSAAEARGSTAEMTYAVRFVYPEQEARELQQQMEVAEKKRDQEVVPNQAVPPELWNLNYTYQGSQDLAPVHMFDDGKFTYFQFRETAEIPAIFLVNPDRSEALVNFHVRGKYVVVERTASQFTLRTGSNVACVFNEASPPAEAAPAVAEASHGR